MECTPFHDQSPASRTRCCDFGSHQGVIRRHDSEKRPRPVRNHRDGADQKAQLFCLPPGDEAEQATCDRERRLHCEPTLIGRLPFGKQRLVVKSETSWLFGDIDVQCRSREERGDDQRKMTNKHISPFRVFHLSVRLRCRRTRLLPPKFGARTCGSAGTSCRTAGNRCRHCLAHSTTSTPSYTVKAARSFPRWRLSCATTTTFRSKRTEWIRRPRSGSCSAPRQSRTRRRSKSRSSISA